MSIFESSAKWTNFDTPWSCCGEVHEHDFSTNDAQTKKEIKVARRKVVEEYVNKKLVNISERTKKLVEQLVIFEGLMLKRKSTPLLKPWKRRKILLHRRSMKAKIS